MEAAEMEAAELQARYERVVSDGRSRGVASEIAALEAAVDASCAVIARPLGEVQRLAQADTELYATYYELIGGRVRVPKGEDWDVLRAVVDSALFPGFKEHIRFAALSLDGSGLWNYGQYSLVLRESMISHRASLLEENSVLWMERHDVRMATAARLPKGYRCSWENRAKLAVAKLGDAIRPGAVTDTLARVLRQGATSREDEFIEVHVMGPMSIRTLERVLLRPEKRRAARVIIRDLKEKLELVGVELEEVR